MEFKEQKLANLCTVNQGLQIPISKRYKEPGINRFFYITVQFLKGNTDQYYIENPKKSVICNKNEILVVRTGNTGQVLTNVEGCFHNNFFKVTPKEIILPGFLYYSLNNIKMYNKMISVASGTTILDLNHSSFLNLEINLPSIINQKKIVDILTSIDLKIQINNKINENLQKVSQILFKRWFLDFEFPNEESKPYKSSGGVMVESEFGLIPDGWSVINITKICKKISKGSTPTKEDFENSNGEKTIMFIKVKDVSNEKNILLKNVELIPIDIHEKTLKRSIVLEDDILFSIAGTIGRTAIITKELNESNINQAIAFIRLKDVAFKSYIYNVLKNKEFQSNIKSKIVQGVQENLSLGVLGNEKIVFSESYTFLYLVEKLDVILNETINLISENEYLSKLKDILLPKLLNGEINLENINLEV